MRNQILNLGAIMVIVAILSGCQPTSEASRKELIETFDALDSSVEAGDLDAFVSFYSETAFHLPPGAPRNSTRAEIKEFLKGTLGLYVLTGEPEIYFSDDATMAFLYGEYEIQADESKNIDAFQGRFISVWKKDADGWECVVDIWNTDDPKFEHL